MTEPRATREAGQATRQRIVEAAMETLKTRGFAGTSARAIARVGGFNQALIFYHFGSVTEALLAALDLTSSRRMARYREEVEGARTLPDLVEAAARIYREDLESGHITVLAEMIAGASTVPELGPAIVERVEPWIRFTEEAVARVIGDSPLASIAPPRELAFAIVALYLGMELLTHLEGEPGRAEALFRMVGGLAGFLAPLLEIPSGG